MFGKFLIKKVPQIVKSLKSLKFDINMTEENSKS